MIGFPTVFKVTCNRNIAVQVYGRIMIKSLKILKIKSLHSHNTVDVALVEGIPNTGIFLAATLTQTRAKDI